MNDTNASTSQPELASGADSAHVPPMRAALILADPTERRLVEGVALQLQLVPQAFAENDLAGIELFDFELIIADQHVARALRPRVTAEQLAERQLRPALVAVSRRLKDSQPQDALVADGDFDAMLELPATPANLASRLGVVLYAHRSFSRRYQPSLEELDLNRSIFRSVTNGISVADARHPDMPLLYVNPAFELITGYRLEEIQGRNCRFLQNDEHDQPGLTLLREAIRDGRETRAVIRNYRKNGDCFWNELSLSPIRNRAGELTHFVGIQSDVTERVEFERALRESEKLAAVGRLASSIAHEINNPLEAVMNLVYLARVTSEEASSVGEAAQYLRQAEDELNRIKVITAQSLRFSKQSSAPEAVTCAELVASVLDLYKGRLANYNVSAAQRMRCDEHIVVLVSEVRQVLSNLVANAIDAMKQNPGALMLRARVATDWKTARRGVIFTVADTGPGMSTDTLAKMYKAFYTTKGASGTGLGLWISSEIVARHNGRLRVRSRRSGAAGKRSGTVFQLFLPHQGAMGDEQASLAGVA